MKTGLPLETRRDSRNGLLKAELRQQRLPLDTSSNFTPDPCSRGILPYARAPESRRTMRERRRGRSPRRSPQPRIAQEYAGAQAVAQTEAPAATQNRSGACGGNRGLLSSDRRIAQEYAAQTAGNWASAKGHLFCRYTIFGALARDFIAIHSSWCVARGLVRLAALAAWCAYSAQC